MSITNHLRSTDRVGAPPAPPTPSALSFTVRPHDVPPGTLVAVNGEVDLATADDLLRTLCAVATVERHTLLVDLAGVSFFDCAGLRVVSQLQDAMARQGGHLVVRNARPLVTQLLALSQLDHMLVAS
jgi:anti-anti-sigma factor